MISPDRPHGLRVREQRVQARLGAQRLPELFLECAACARGDVRPTTRRPPRRAVRERNQPRPHFVVGGMDADADLLPVERAGDRVVAHVREDGGARRKGRRAIAGRVVWAACGRSPRRRARSAARGVSSAPSAVRLVTMGRSPLKSTAVISTSKRISAPWRCASRGERRIEIGARHLERERIARRSTSRRS